MAKHISREKLSAKKRKALDAARRRTWGFSPVTRTKESGKIYNRKRTRNRDFYDSPSVSFYFIDYYFTASVGTSGKRTCSGG